MNEKRKFVCPVKKMRAGLFSAETLITMIKNPRPSAARTDLDFDRNGAVRSRVAYLFRSCWYVLVSAGPAAGPLCGPGPCTQHSKKHTRALVPPRAAENWMEELVFAGTCE